MNRLLNSTTFFLETINKYAPLKCLADKKSKVPKWFTNSLKNLRFKKNKAHRSMKQNPQDNEAAKNSNYYATCLEKVFKKLKKDFVTKISNHVLETQGEHISY